MIVVFGLTEKDTHRENPCFAIPPPSRAELYYPKFYRLTQRKFTVQ